MQASAISYANAYAPFRLAAGKPDPVRALGSKGGVEDRLRLVAFAELQARDLFRLGEERFRGMAPEGWTQTWLRFSEVEETHTQLLLDRMEMLGLGIASRTVSDKLSRLCRKTEDPILFLFLLASAEERGMEAGFKLAAQMAPFDPDSAAIFARIACEEVEHVEMAKAALAPFAADRLQEQARTLSALL